MLCNKRASVNCPPLGGSSPLSQLSKGASKLAGKQGCRCSAIPESSPRSVRLSQDAALTVSSCLSAATDGHADALLQHLPDGVLDHCIARRKSARLNTPGIQVHDLSFEDVVRTSHKKDFACDAYGQRSLIFQPLQGHKVLSSMLLGLDKYVQRCATTNATGEQSILTFELDKQECLEAQYKGVRVVDRWVLHSIKGECACIEQPLEAHPSLSPDAVVLAQLHALRWGLDATFATLASQAGKGRFGFPSGAAQSTSLHYMPLRHYTSAEVITVLQTVAHRATVVLDVSPDEQYIKPSTRQLHRLVKGQAQQGHVFLWSMALQTSGPLMNCWLTDHVQYTRPIDGLKIPY